MKNHPPSHHLVAFVYDNQSCRIEPGHLLVRSGDSICFGSVGSDFTAWFPEPQILGLEDMRVDLGKNDSKCFRVASPGKDRIYRYAVYSKETRGFAKGGSDGEIIIMT